MTATLQMPLGLLCVWPMPSTPLQISQFIARAFGLVHLGYRGSLILLTLNSFTAWQIQSKASVQQQIIEKTQFMDTE